ncbi:BQ5605_C015g08017 [Microbotryum silenes-dioicae]|uniref:BQ5605_C015g08017 protein n=1 Tax=Microbotryum silenes-dioicae TaxID=796604 RepID=A0A2X0LY28_9BASI|nr:BQ5605_C015g08017 [Microbotryum silenes-dioicae]
MSSNTMKSASFDRNAEQLRSSEAGREPTASPSTRLEREICAASRDGQHAASS